MAGDEKNEKTLEMRVAELEDKLAQVHITEDEMKAYQKVAGLLGAGNAAAAAPGGGSVSAGCVVDCAGGCINECGVIIRQCCVVRQCIRFCIPSNPIISQCIIQQCINECGGGWGIAGGGAGFGQLGG